MQHFWYQIKMMFRSPTAIFWSLVFPIILGALFYFMFGNIGNVEQFSEIPVGIVEVQEDSIFMAMAEQVEMEEGVSMFQVERYKERAEAETALKEDALVGFIVLDGESIELILKESSIQGSIIQTFLDQYLQNKNLIVDTAVTHPEQAAALIKELYSGEQLGITDIPLKGQDKDPYTQYFYALLAMACLISSSFGVQNGLSVQANLSPVGARRNVAPTRKMEQVLIDFFATLCIYCVLMTGVLAVLVFVYKQDFGSNVGFILLGTYVGSFTGLAAGTMLSVLIKGPRAVKEGLSVAFFMVSSFLAGLQWGDITYLLEKNCPIVNRINPATLIVNAYKSLTVFGDYRQYGVNLITLLIIGGLFLIVSINELRRCRYASL